MFYTVYFAAIGINHLVSGPFETIEEAASARQVSGDLVCRLSGGEYEVVTDDRSWLFDWEDDCSYAGRHLHQQEDPS